MEKPLPPDTSLHIPVSNGYIIALLACSGLYTWEVIQSLPIDWKMVKGRRGCRWGAAIFYFPLRIVALVHFACSMSLLFPPPWQPEGVVDVRYTRESTAMISRTCTYHIIMLYIASLWHFRTLSWALFALILALWIVNAYGISRMQTSWFLSTMPGVISCTLIFLSTLLFALFVGGILRMRSQPHLVPQSRRTRYAKTPVWYMLWKEKLHLIVLIWAAQIVTSVAGLSRFNSVAWSIADITCYTIIVSCGGRVYQHSIRRGSQCPTLSYYWCPVSSAVRAGLSQKHCVNIEMDTFVAGVSRAGAQPQHQPRRQEQTPTLRVVTRDLHVRSDPIEMTTYPLSCSEADSPSSISASQKMLSTQAMIHSGPSSSTTIFPPDAASFSSRIAKAPSWAGSRDMQDRGGAG